MNIKNLKTKIVVAIKKKTLRGFTLIEALAGIFILTIVIAGPMTIAGKAAQDIRSSKQRYVAVALAQEAIELLRFKRDTLFLECSDASSGNCPLSTFTGTSGQVTEFKNEAAWRIFKQQFGSAGVGTKCFTVNGCTYDAYSLSLNPLFAPADLYDAIDTSCDTLYQDKSMSLKQTFNSSSADYMYLCKSHKPAGATDVKIQRVVKMVSTSTFSAGTYDSLYNDEVKVDVTVQYKFNGFDKTILVTDYIRPRS